MNKLVLKDDMGIINQWWNNFHHSCNGDWANIKDTLASQNIKMVYFGLGHSSGFVSHLEFETEQELTFFLLKWR